MPDEPKSGDNLLPRSLDDIVRKNRHLCSLRLSSHEELNAFPSMVSLMVDQRQVKAMVSDWRFICWVRPEEMGGAVHFLTGINQARQRILMTSDVRAVDFGNGLVLTNNSLYRLGRMGNGEPNMKILLHICAVFHSWGIGEHLGVPHIYYRQNKL